MKSKLLKRSSPANFKDLDVSWFEIESDLTSNILTAIARPKKFTDYPTVVLFHGSHGFAKEYIQLAKDLASYGIEAVAVCWFQGNEGQGVKFVTPVDEKTGPSIPAKSSIEAIEIFKVVLDTIGSFENIDRNKIGLFGHSRGGMEALNYLIKGGTIKALALNSSGYTRYIVDKCSKVKPSILILHGVKDLITEGGSENTDINRVYEFEASLKKSNNDVQSKYYKNGGHNSFFIDRSQYEDEVKLVANFFLDKLN